MKNLKTIRQSSKKTQNQVASDLNIPVTTYATYEQNKATPATNKLIEIANYFNCSIDYLLGHETSGIIHVDSLSVPEQKLLSYMKQLDADQILRLVGYCEVILGITNSNLKPVRPW